MVTDGKETSAIVVASSIAKGGISKKNDFLLTHL